MHFQSSFFFKIQLDCVFLCCAWRITCVLFFFFSILVDRLNMLKNIAQNNCMPEFRHETQTGAKKWMFFVCEIPERQSEASERVCYGCAFALWARHNAKIQLNCLFVIPQVALCSLIMSTLKVLLAHFAGGSLQETSNLLMTLQTVNCEMEQSNSHSFRTDSPICSFFVVFNYTRILCECVAYFVSALLHIVSVYIKAERISVIFRERIDITFYDYGFSIFLKL